MRFHRRWRHTWEPTSLNYVDYLSGWKTQVLYRCECGKSKVREKRGRWTLKELFGS